METPRYRECLLADFTRLREIAATTDTGRPVPSCPDWSLADLARHVAEVYLHKAESMRRGVFPEPWPVDVSGEEPVKFLDRTYRQLSAEFDARPAAERTAHWYEPDPSVGCLVRRMAQETVIHRVDAELAAGAPVTPVPPDLALDGTDEILEVMLEYMTQRWPEEFVQLPGPEERDAPPVRLTADDRGWLVTPTADGVAVVGARARAGGVVNGEAAAVSADPQSLLLWLWGRADDDAVSIAGDPAAVARLRALLREATQ